MIKNTLLVFILFCTISSYAQYNLTVKITNLENNTGQVALELLDENEKSIKGKRQPIGNNKCTIEFFNLKEGQYAIRYFHDENMNKEMDTNFIGIPKEGIGFSNDAYGKFGPEDFEEWLFTVDKDLTTTLITTYY